LHIGILPLITKLIGFEEAALAYRNGKFYTPPLVIQHLLYSITYYHTLLIVVFYYFDREFIKVNLFKHRAVIYKGSVFGQSRREVFFDFAEIKEIAGGTAFIFYCGYEKIKVSMSTSNFGSKRLVEYAAKNDINYT
jgi:hypothetical protein